MPRRRRCGRTGFRELHPRPPPCPEWNTVPKLCWLSNHVASTASADPAAGNGRSAVGWISSLLRCLLIKSMSDSWSQRRDGALIPLPSLLQRWSVLGYPGDLPSVSLHFQRNLNLRPLGPESGSGSRVNTGPVVLLTLPFRYRYEITGPATALRAGTQRDLPPGV